LTATFLIGEPRPVLVVSRSALLTAAEGTFVYAVNGTHFTRTKIKIGATTDGFVEVEDGLYSGDKVVAKGMESLWLIELSALKGGKPCCAVPRREPPSGG
jgi:multidrug efflux pump subunit AcrA (membrane-fusion protein)